MSTPTVRLAIGSPIVTSGAPWANAGSIEDLARIAEAGDRLGYHHLTCSEHIALPAAELDRRGAVYWDPLATFGYLAARTERIALRRTCSSFRTTIPSRSPSATARSTA
jgi:alkanesulfonate monooxygenase SsuD/methylene tetrahydromethanopterin reductase-like flavin-dependent oxidoreductase (luciferase family)